MKDARIIKSGYEECRALVYQHACSLYSPFDSWLEEALLGSDIYKLLLGEEAVGYCATKGETLKFFYVASDYFNKAAGFLEKAVEELCIKKIMGITQDSALCALLGEWDYEICRDAWIFCDSERKSAEKTIEAVFRKAETKDCGRIREMAGDFFDEESCGYSSLEERIEAGTVFVLEQKDGSLLGGGIIEYGRICTECVSIGMFTNPGHRKKGVARTMLLSLKEYVYSIGKKPVAGCWYYNILSRKSLESAGMNVASFVFEAELAGKDRPPKMTGNRPGELVE